CAIAGLEGYSDSRSSPVFIGFSFGPVPRPLALPINNSFVVAATTVGYHSVGTNPTARNCVPAAEWLRSNTPTESEIAFAENSVFSSSLSARYSGSLPPYFCPGNFVESVYSTFPPFVSITSIYSRLVNPTNSRESSRLSSNAVG